MDRLSWQDGPYRPTQKLQCSAHSNQESSQAPWLPAVHAESRLPASPVPTTGRHHARPANFTLRPGWPPPLLRTVPRRACLAVPARALVPCRGPMILSVFHGELFPLSLSLYPSFSAGLGFNFFTPSSLASCLCAAHTWSLISRPSIVDSRGSSSSSMWNF